MRWFDQCCLWGWLRTVVQPGVRVSVRVGGVAGVMACVVAGVMACVVAGVASGPAWGQPAAVSIANLVYAGETSAQCFSEQFLTDVNRETSIRISAAMSRVELASGQLFEHPFAVMSGEGAFALTGAERSALRGYLQSGGFVVASAGCSSKPWGQSLERELETMYPEATLEELPAGHPVFHTVYDIAEVEYKRGAPRLPTLKALTLGGRIVLVYSPDGLNDTGNAGGDCCCCGGNEIKSARQINVNLLAYAMAR